VAFDLGNLDRAEPLLERALVKFQELGNKRGIVFARIYLGGVAQHRGDYERARELFVECLVTSRELGDKQHIVRSLECLAGLAAARENYERALELDGAALALRETFGARRTPIEQRMLERALAPAAGTMRDSGIRRTRAAGRSRLLDAVIELALKDNGE
jgi:tetratricopeptide (TPR) repeat protein